MYEEPGIFYEVMWVAVPAAVIGVLVGLGVFAGVYFAISSAAKRLPHMYKDSAPRDASELAVLGHEKSVAVKTHRHAFLLRSFRL